MQTISIKIPVEYYHAMMKFCGKGRMYYSISEFVRDAVRRLLREYEEVKRNDGKNPSQA